ncbi:hypothetical protein A8A12_12205 [Serratia marcescens]|nr:hypothetical protein A8A12_12205 [Serratia marcescens]
MAGAAIKDIADKMTSDELDHLVTLKMMGNDEITGKYLSSLQDKYAPNAASNPNIGKNLTDGQKKELGGRGLELRVGMGQRMRKQDEIVTLHQTLKVGSSMKNMWTHYVHQWKNQMLKMEILKT